jgi:hypothetical protein
MVIIVDTSESQSSNEFRLLLVEGIRGGKHECIRISLKALTVLPYVWTGIVAPRIRQAIEIVGDGNGGAIVTHARDVGVGKGDAEGYETKEGRLSAEETQVLLTRLRGDLSNLPDPSMHEFTSDLFGKDVRLEFQDGEKYWVNGAPEGCSYQDPTSSQLQTFSTEVKETFSNLVDYIMDLSRERAQDVSIRAII